MPVEHPANNVVRENLANFTYPSFVLYTFSTKLRIPTIGNYELLNETLMYREDNVGLYGIDPSAILSRISSTNSDLISYYDSLYNKINGKTAQIFDFYAEGKIFYFDLLYPENFGLFEEFLRLTGEVLPLERDEVDAKKTSFFQGLSYMFPYTDLVQ